MVRASLVSCGISSSFCSLGLKTLLCRSLCALARPPAVLARPAPMSNARCRSACHGDGEWLQRLDIALRRFRLHRRVTRRTIPDCLQVTLSGDTVKCSPCGTGTDLSAIHIGVDLTTTMSVTTLLYRTAFFRIVFSRLDGFFF